ncbi:MAG TPA: hypothetical protein DCR14_18590 [Acidimicrobiaceae bacterium]|nr:hypothetical protein [Acidimicrobiaceae bacterium]
MIDEWAVVDGVGILVSGPRDEFDALVLGALEVPRSVGDVLFLFPALGEAGLVAVDEALERLSELALVQRRAGGRLWELTEPGSRWLDEQAEWQIHVDRVGESTDSASVLTGVLARGVVKVGDWFHDGVGNTCRVVQVYDVEPGTRSVSVSFEPASIDSVDLDAASNPLTLGVIRQWTPRAIAEDFRRLSPPAWHAETFTDDLFFDRSLPDISAAFAEDRTWSDVHSALGRSGLRWEVWRGSARQTELPSVDDVFDMDGDRYTLKAWVGPVQFNAHYWTRDEVDFDVAIGALADPSSFECVVAFMDWLASIAGSVARLEHEGMQGLVIRVSEPADTPGDVVVWDRLRLAGLRNPEFGVYRDVVAPAWGLDETNIDAWLERHDDADAVTSVLCHLHLWDEIESTSDEVVLGKVAATVAERWRAALAAQLPNRAFTVGVIGEPEEYGPTVRVRAFTPTVTEHHVDRLDPTLKARFEAVVAARWTGAFRADDAVAIATDVLAAGIDEPAVLELAMQPTDHRVLRIDDIRSLFDACCAALGVMTPTAGSAGWQRAREIASAIISGTLTPGEGAAQLWPLWRECGTVPGSDPLDMLQLSEEWEGAVGEGLARAEERIVASARSVVADADRALAALAVPFGAGDEVIRARDVMPLLLNAAPSFLSTWYGIEDDHLSLDVPGGRLHYLDAGAFARHVIEIHRGNNRRWLQNAFDVIERMHTDGDVYVAELATIGYLEGIQNIAGHAGVDPEVFVPYLGPESLRWWRGLDRFWAGEHPTVEPNDDEPSGPGA